ncbi:ROK family protein [Microterricola viridarii]|uniref:Sugar kinase n=1 Tax=Microterricola viridarii TaxID=412690 RepID=A0A120I128_9MICO|nr:ROK family protein [Microterricola viridarii]AMB60320.1 sugar kinase [Microterricola viridarii]
MSELFAIALDIGGTKVEAALVDGHGAVLAGSRHRAPTGRERSAEQLADSVRTVLDGVLALIGPDAAVSPASVLGVGIGAAGPVNLAEARVSPLNMPVWDDYPLSALVADIVHPVVPGIPVTLRLDGLCITLAEHWVGAASGHDNVLGMIVSTGVGGGLILGGRTVPGPTGNAGHVGHLEVGGHEDACPCGGSGCLEAVASGPRTVAWANGQGWVGDTGEQLAAAVAAGDPVALRAVERSGRAIGRAIASAASLVDLDVVAIGGGFSHVSPLLFEHARAAVAERATFGYVTRLQIVPSALSGEGPLIGAAALIHRAEMVG